MGFKISELNTEKPKTIWVPVEGTDTLYVGQIVQSTSDGFAPLGAASGVNNVSQGYIPFGIVVGTNYRKPVYNSTYKANSITGVTAHTVQDDIEKVGGHGFGNPAGDQQAKVEIAVITPSTVIDGYFFNSSYGTAMTEVTATAVSATGGTTGPTTGACDFTPVADLCTMYCRSGNNAGAMRITTDTSTTVPTVTHAFPNVNGIAVGDVFVRVPARIGVSYIQFDAESTYIEGSASPATDYYVVQVVSMDLTYSGKEQISFMFNPENWSVLRTVFGAIST